MDSAALPVNILVAISNSILCECLCDVLKGRLTKYRFFTDLQKNPATPDLVLFDPGTGMEPLQARYPAAKFILIDSGLSEQEISYLLVYHQLSGVLPPDSSLEMLFKALNVVLDGQIWIENKHLKTLLQNNGSLNRSGGIKALSRQDKKIVELVTRGLKNREIADQLCLSEHTIKAHLSRIFKALNLNSRTQLVSLVLEDGQNKRLDRHRRVPL